MIISRRMAVLPLGAAALLAAAAVLWLSAAAPSGAASADQVQGTAVTVPGNTIGWGSAGNCVQSMGTADFGSVLPGATAQSAAFNGCVTSSSAGWSMTARATDLTGPGAAVVPKGNLRIKTAAVAGALATSCLGSALPTSGCNLDVERTLVSGGPVGTSSLGYDYALTVGSTTPAAAYSGTVTFTASN